MVQAGILVLWTYMDGEATYVFSVLAQFLNWFCFPEVDVF
jgi:hypothetical protein